MDRGGYTEIVTSSALDAPQEGRIIEVWRDLDSDDCDVELRYWTFSHLEEVAPTDASHVELFDDPLLPMRRVASDLAGASSATAYAKAEPEIED